MLSARLCLLGTSAAACLACSALETGIGGFGETVLLPSDSYVEGPGRKLAAGSFSQFALDPVEATGPHVISFRHQNGLTELVSLPFEGGPPCSLGPAVAYSVFASTGERPRRISYLESRGSSALLGKLRFGDYACRHYLEPIEDAQLPLYAGDPSRFLTLTGRGELFRVDPWQQVRTTVAEGVRSYEPVSHSSLPAGGLWLLEEGKLVLRDAEGLQRASFGDGVTEYRALTETRAHPYVVAYSDKAGTSLVARGLASIVRLDEPACAFSTLSGSRETNDAWLAYRAPCEEGLLVLQELSGRERVEVAPSVTAAPRFLLGAGGKANLAYLVGGNGRVGRLMLGPLREPAREVSAAADFRSLSVPRAGVLRLIVDSNGQAGSLVEVDSETFERVTLAERVTADFSLGYLANFDGLVGDLLRADSDGRVRIVTQGVPQHAAVITEERVLFLDSFAAGTGRLVLANSDDPAFERLITIAQGVPPNAFRLVQESPVALYLTRYDVTTASGQLRGQLLTTGDDLPVADNVREFYATLWPKPGVLYSAVGAAEGLWFAAAR
jgi:hypothetical protein